MLSIEDIKLLNDLLEEIDVDYKYQTLKTKIGYVCDQINLSEKTNKEISEIQDKIRELDKKEEKEND